ncbi:peptide MFS transporter [Porphyromonas cangingivalis]|uniref:peptide MFS transporter n=1 Tax=Porphyromonas cangingivalis TaxID=36874 RepID=UPI00242C039B|nr:peptide MFS transporter [Porphyromonas cangingivalis]
MAQRKKHPNGLIAAALANMGERFGFYTMMAILVLFLGAKFGLSESEAGLIYSTFYFGIYALALIGGIVADRTRKYKTTILAGLVFMTIGYAILSIPTTITLDNKTMMLIFTCFALFVIAFGNGLFKGNLQALVGQMYDRGDYTNKERDAGFTLFYMFINIGSMFAPFVAPVIREKWLNAHNFTYDAKLPELCHRFMEGNITPEQSAIFEQLANKVSIGGLSTSLGDFAASYLDVFNTGFHYSFAVAIVTMLISLVIFITNKNKFPDPGQKVAKTGAQETPVAEMDPAEVRQRIFALGAVMAVVIFFWFSFHQNGLTLTYFAKDFTFLPTINIGSFSYSLAPENFQSLNPFFVVTLAPAVLAFFGFMAARGLNITTPMKITIGMGLAAVGFLIMTLGSFDLPLLSEAKNMSPEELAPYLASPWLLVGTYFVLTIAELFISPLGLSFVSQVAPPKLQGLMQGLWLLATGLGNQLLFIGAILYKNTALYITWAVFVIVCIISMFIMLSMVKWLNRVTGQSTK